ncbi:MAG: hypothetical protein NTX50_11795 [Candidatus Sumerlaeota bacterium]|nr:hypothetical protein [Candidatus Sumerlaeota bacterium]
MRFEARDNSDGRYLWLPLEFENGKLVLRWQDEWNLSWFDTHKSNWYPERI